MLLMSNVPAVYSAALYNGGPNCGTHMCLINQYCSKYNMQCADCSSICDQSSHNYEEELCLKDCQGKPSSDMLTTCIFLNVIKDCTFALYYLFLMIS